jgi:hypothetical protein
MVECLLGDALSTLLQSEMRMINVPDIAVERTITAMWRKSGNLFCPFKAGDTERYIHHLS